MKLFIVAVFLTVVAMGAGAQLGPWSLDIPNDDDVQHQMESVSRGIKSAVDSAASLADDVASGQWAKDLANPPSEEELQRRQLKKDLQRKMDAARNAVGNFFKGAGKSLRRFRDDIAAAAGSASLRWTGYSGIAALLGTWVAVLVVM